LASRIYLCPGIFAPVIGSSIVAGRLRHCGLIVPLALLLGPGYMGARLLAERSGVAAASIKRPTRMSPGVWTIAITDNGNLQVSRGQARGTSDIRITTFARLTSKSAPVIPGKRA
jgi:hypothetical protein